MRRPSEDEANLLLDCIPAVVENAYIRGVRVRMADELDDR
jgi:hypothetical protein